MPSFTHRQLLVSRRLFLTRTCRPHSPTTSPSAKTCRAERSQSTTRTTHCGTMLRPLNSAAVRPQQHLYEPLTDCQKQADLKDLRCIRQCPHLLAPQSCEQQRFWTASAVEPCLSHTVRAAPLPRRGRNADTTAFYTRVALGTAKLALECKTLQTPSSVQSATWCRFQSSRFDCGRLWNSQSFQQPVDDLPREAPESADLKHLRCIRQCPHLLARDCSIIAKL